MCYTEGQKDVRTWVGLAGCFCRWCCTIWRPRCGCGRCRMAVASRSDYQEDTGRTLRVATKFENIAKRYYASLNRDIEIIHLNGSIELAPLLGLSDVIVDIVESGTTIRENHLKVLTEFMQISARFIANKSSFKFKNEIITQMTEKLNGVIKV